MVLAAKNPEGAHHTTTWKIYHNSDIFWCQFKHGVTWLYSHAAFFRVRLLHGFVLPGVVQYGTRIVYFFFCFWWKNPICFRMLVFVWLDMFIWTHAMQSPAVEKLVFTPRIATVKFLACTSPISELIFRFMDKQTAVFVQQTATKMAVIFVVSLGHWIQEDSHNCLKKLRTSTLAVCNIIHKPSPIRYEGHSCDYFVAKQDGTSCRYLWRLWAKSVVHNI